MGAFIDFQNNFVDNWRTDFLFLTLAFFLGTLLLWVFTVIPSYAQVANTFLIMLIVAGFIHLVTIGLTAVGASIPQPFANAPYGLGTGTYAKVFLGLILGAVVIFSKALILPLPQSVPDIPASQIPQLLPFGLQLTQGGLAFIFQVVSAPLVEEYFFRSLVFPITFYLLSFYARLPELLAGGLALLLQALVFMSFHFLVYGSNPAALWSVFVFGLVAGLLVIQSKSIATGMGLHFANNLLLFTGF